MTMHTWFHLKKLKDFICPEEYTVAVLNGFSVCSTLEDVVELRDNFKAAEESSGQRPTQGVTLPCIETLKI